MSEAHQSGDASRSTPTRHVRCPHCHSPMALPEDRTAEVVCPGCGSSFRLQDAPLGTTTQEVRTLGRFQVLGRVGAGAFGEVWRARDPQLDRLVALKLLHPSLVGSAADRERFFREARAAAQLRHPGIVTVHEVTTLDGVPAIVADFVDGVTLRELLSARRLTFREAAELVAQVAEALDYAHQMGLVHRDVKPANIMIEIAPGRDASSADTVPRPLLLDFGLALRDEVEVTMTVDGQIVGTPAYMSPEQAAGHGHRVDRRSDVYSLGVVLYELLAGELPFRGSKGMLRFQVLHEEPRPPRRINDKIPRDLETICLKALTKQPGGRYATARDLADDLRRFLKGEPVRARRVGPVGRLARWARRRPAVAALLLALAVLLVGGSRVLIYYRLDAAAARIAAADATAQQAQLEKQQAQERERLTQEALEKVEDTLAENLLRPVGRERGPLKSAELEAFQDLAGSPSERVRLRFIEKALERPETAQRLARRSEIAAHTVVGLDLRQRDRALQLLLGRLQDKTTEPEVRGACVLLGAALQPRDETFCREAGKEALELVATRTDSSDLARAVGALADRLPPQEAEKLRVAAARKLVQAMAKQHNTYDVHAPPLPELALAVGALADRLPSQEAAAAAQEVTEAMADLVDVYTLDLLAQAVGALADRLPPQEAEKLRVATARKLVEAMATLLKNYGLHAPVNDLAAAVGALADRLPPQEAGPVSAAAVEKLVGALAQTDQADTRQSLAQAVGALAARLPPQAAAAAFQEAVEAIAREARAKTPDGRALSALARAAGALTPRLPPPEAAAAAQTLVETMAKTPDVWPLVALAQALGARLPPREAAAAAQKLVEAMAKTADGNALSALAQAVGALAPRLPPREAAAAAQTLVDAMAKPADGYALFALAQAVGALAGWLPPEEAAKVAAAAAQKLLEAMAKPRDTDGLRFLAQGVGALAGRLPPQEAAAVAQELLEAMANPGYPLLYLAGAVGALADRLPPQEAAAAAHKLVGTMGKTADAYALAALASAVSALAAQLPPEEGAEVSVAAAQKVVEAMAKPADANPLFALAQALGALGARLPPEEAAKVSAAAAQKVVEAMAKPRDAAALGWLARAVGALPAWLPPEKADKASLRAAASLLDFAATDTSTIAAADRSRVLPTLLSKLSSQGSVDLLKQASCLGESRRAVLKELGRRLGPPAPEAAPLAACTITAPQPCPLSAGVLLAHGDSLYPGGRRPFADLWEAVDWIHDHHPELDLDSPPQRAGR